MCLYNVQVFSPAAIDLQVADEDAYHQIVAFLKSNQETNWWDSEEGGDGVCLSDRKNDYTALTRLNRTFRFPVKHRHMLWPRLLLSHPLRQG